MGRVKGYLEIEKHVAIGRELFDMRERLLHIAVMVLNQYGVTKMPGKKLMAAVDRLDNARNEMDSQFARERANDYCPHVYYPGGQSDRVHHKMIGCETCYPTTSDGQDIKSQEELPAQTGEDEPGNG